VGARRVVRAGRLFVPQVAGLMTILPAEVCAVIFRLAPGSVGTAILVLPARVLASTA